jgi:hypothetical protein
MFKVAIAIDSMGGNPFYGGEAVGRKVSDQLKPLVLKGKMAHPAGFEPATKWFEATKPG